MRFSLKILSSVLIFSIIVTGCGNPESSEGEIEEGSLQVEEAQNPSRSNLNINTVTYGSTLESGGTREILATVETNNEVSIVSEISGTVDSVDVVIGQSVSQGQVLLKFQKKGDTTQTQYLNALNSVNATASSGEITIAQSKLSVESAQDALNETIKSQEVSLLQAETTLENAQKSLDVNQKSQKATLLQAEVTLDNAKKVLEKTLTTQSSTLAQAETAYENAKRSYDQTVTSGDQNFSQNYTTLKTQSDSAVETYDVALEYLDRMLGITDRKKSLSVAGRSEVGSVNFKLKNAIKNDVQQLILDTNAYRLEIVEDTEETLKAYTDLRINLGKEVEDALIDYIELTDYSVVSSSFSQDTLNGIRSEAESYRSQVNVSYSSLQSTLEGAKTSRIGNEGSLIGGENSLASAQVALAASRSQAEAAISNAQNAVDSAQANFEFIESQADASLTASQNAIENAEAGLDFAQAQSEAAISSARNSVKNAQGSLNLSYAQARVNNQNAQGTLNIAAVTQSKLQIESPISGKITQRQVNEGVYVGAGTNLFTVVNDSQSKKAVAFVSPQEWETLNQLNEVELKVNDKTITSTKKSLSTKADPVTQKLRVEFWIDEPDVLVGTLVRVIIPLSGDSKNLLPVSSVSFEPDGPEVLVLDQSGIAKRQKIKTGKIIGNNLEILDGLKKGDKVVRNPSEVVRGETAP